MYSKLLSSHSWSALFLFFFNVCLHCLFFYAKMSAAGNKSYIILGLIASSFLSFRFIHKHQIRVRAKPMFNVIYLILGEDELKNITPKLQSWRYLSYLLNSQLILSEHLLWVGPVLGTGDVVSKTCVSFVQTLYPGDAVHTEIRMKAYTHYENLYLPGIPVRRNLLFTIRKDPWEASSENFSSPS